MFAYSYSVRTIFLSGRVKPRPREDIGPGAMNRAGKNPRGNRIPRFVPPVRRRKERAQGGFNGGREASSKKRSHVKEREGDEEEEDEEEA